MASGPSSTTMFPNADSRYPRFKEHLSISVPPPNYPVEASRFSPDSPPSHPSRSQSTWTKRDSNTVASTRPGTPNLHMTPKRDIEASTITTSPRSAFSRLGDRFTKLTFDMRTIKREKEQDVLPIQNPYLPAWEPLHVEKRGCCHDCPCHQKKENKKKRSRRDRILIILLVLVILYLLGDTLFLNIRVVNMSVVPPANNTASTSNKLSADAQQCLTQYNVNAPADPTSYPCSSCLPVLQAVPSDFSDGNEQDSQQIQNAIQFCGLRAIFDTMDQTGQTALRNGEWVNDVKFCAWSGVSCDGSGKVGSLTLTFPAVPATLPNEIGVLTGLQGLHVIGNGAIPAGSLPTSFTSLSVLSTLHLESTAITSMPDNIFTSLNKISTLELIKNSAMGNDLPSSISSLSLQNLIINGQNLNNPLSALSSSSSLQSSLKLLDLSSTSISGVIPASISSFSSLVELHLDSNSLATPLPPTFPNSLQSLSMSNNPNLQGSISGSFCALPNLQTCNMRSTGLSAAGGCGVCQFQ